jgi:hypothetical protein
MMVYGVGKLVLAEVWRRMVGRTVLGLGVDGSRAMWTMRSVAGRARLG